MTTGLLSAGGTIELPCAAATEARRPLHASASTTRCGMRERRIAPSSTARHVGLGVKSLLNAGRVVCPESPARRATATPDRDRETLAGPAADAAGTARLA